jgi:ABC-2 type transport system ATP-binding protein
VVEIEVFGIPPEYVDKLSQLDFVDSVAVENHDQRSVLLIHTPNGPEAIPLLVEQLSGLKLGKIVTRQPTLEDAYVRLVGGAE